MRTILALLVLLVAALAGCADEPATEPDAHDGMEHESGEHESDEGMEAMEPVECGPVDETNGTRTGDDGCPVPNHPPVASLSVDIITAPEGETITFSFQATDDDEDALQWALDVNGDGTNDAEGGSDDLPGTFAHAYDLAGDYTATFTVFDANVSDNASVDVTIVPDSTPLQFEAYFSEPCPLCSQDPSTSISHLSGEMGLDQVWIEIPAEYIGTAFFAKSTGGSLGMMFADACDGAVVASVSTGAPDGTTVTAEGTVPEGAVCAVLWDGATRGGKLSFVADGGEADLPEDPICYTSDFVQIGVSEAGQAVYQTDGTWFYQESNGIPGLQWNNNPSPGIAEVHKPDCTGGDVMLI